jgi:hypothetical protein
LLTKLRGLGFACVSGEMPDGFGATEGIVRIRRPRTLRLSSDSPNPLIGNAANVPDGTGTDPFATFTNSTHTNQLGVAEFAPGSPTGHHGGHRAVYQATWISGDASTLVTSWSQLEAPTQMRAPPRSRGGRALRVGGMRSRTRLTEDRLP